MGSNLQFEKWHYFLSPQQLSVLYLFPGLLSHHNSGSWEFLHKVLLVLYRPTSLKCASLFLSLKKDIFGHEICSFRILRCLPMPFRLKKISSRGELHIQETRPHNALGAGLHSTLRALAHSCLLPHPSPSTPSFQPHLAVLLGKAFGISIKVIRHTPAFKKHQGSLERFKHSTYSYNTSES